MRGDKEFVLFECDFSEKGFSRGRGLIHHRPKFVLANSAPNFANFRTPTKAFRDKFHARSQSAGFSLPCSAPSKPQEAGEPPRLREFSEVGTPLLPLSLRGITCRPASCHILPYIYIYTRRRPDCGFGEYGFKHRAR